MYRHKPKSPPCTESASSGQSSQASTQANSEIRNQLDTASQKSTTENLVGPTSSKGKEAVQLSGDHKAITSSLADNQTVIPDGKKSQPSSVEAAGKISSPSASSVKTTLTKPPSRENSLVKSKQLSKGQQDISKPTSEPKKSTLAEGDHKQSINNLKPQKSIVSAELETERSKPLSTVNVTQTEPRESPNAPENQTSSKADDELLEYLPMMPDLDLEVKTKEPKPRSKKQKRVKEVQSVAPPPPPPPPPTVPQVAPVPSAVGSEEKDQTSDKQSFLLKGLLYNDPNTYARPASKPVFHATELLNQKRKLKKIARRDEFDPVTLGRKELFDKVYEDRNEDPPDFIPLNLAASAIVRTNISADLTHLLLSGLEHLTDMTFALLLGDGVNPVKKYLNLKKLHLVGCCNITDQGIKWLSEAFPEISFIEMHGCIKVTERGLHYLFQNCSTLHVCLAMSCNAAIIPDSICDTMIPKGNITWAGNPVITEGKQYFIECHGAVEDDFFNPNKRKLVILRDINLPYQVLPLLNNSQETSQPSVCSVVQGLKVPSSESPDDSVLFNVLETSLDLPLVDSLVSDGSIVMLVFNTPTTEKDIAEVAMRLACRICSVLLQHPDILILLVDTGQDESKKIYNEIIGILTNINKTLFHTTYGTYSSFDWLDCLDFKGQIFVSHGMSAAGTLVQLLHPDYISSRLIYQQGAKDNFSSWMMPILSKCADIVKNLAPYVHCDYQVNMKEFLGKLPHKGISNDVAIFAQTDQSARKTVTKRYSFPRLGSVLKVLTNWGEALYLRSEKRAICSTDLPSYMAVCDLILNQTPPETVWVHCCRENIPCWTVRSLEIALLKEGLKLDSKDCINMLKRQGLLLCLHSQQYKGDRVHETVAIRWKDIPEQHEILTSLWPQSRPKIRILQSNRVYTLLPVVPSGFMPKVIRTLLKVFNPLLVWKTGFLLRQGPVDIKAELYTNSEKNTVLLLSMRIIQLDMDSRTIDVKAWRQSTDDVRKVKFASGRQVAAVIDYACLKTGVYAHVSLPCQKCAEFSTEGILSKEKTWHLLLYNGLSRKHKTCPKHKMINAHFLFDTAEEFGEGPCIPRHNYPYHVELTSFMHDMIKGKRFRPMDPPERCFYCGRDGEVPCFHCNMCSQCTKHFAKFAKVLQPGGVNSKSFKLSFAKAGVEKDEDIIKCNTKGSIFHYRKGHRMQMHYTMSPFYFDEISFTLLRDTHCVLDFTVGTGEQMKFYTRSGTFVKKTGYEMADEMMKMRDANNLTIKLESVELGRRVRLNFLVRGKVAYSEELDGWDIKLDINCEKSGLYIIRAPGIKRSWQQEEVEKNFSNGSILECALEDGSVHPARILERDPSGFLLLDVNGTEMRLNTSSPQLYPIGTTAAKGGTLASDVPPDHAQVPATAFLKYQVPSGWDNLLRQGLGSNQPHTPDCFDAMYQRDPFLGAFKPTCCAIDFPSVLNARQSLLNDPIEHLLYSSGKYNFSLASVLLLPALLTKEDFSICAQRICINKFKIHPLCYYRADVNSTMTVNPNAKLAKYVECFHSLHMLDNEGYDLKEIQNHLERGTTAVLWAFTRMLLRLQKGSLPQYKALLKDVKGISNLTAPQIHESLQNILKMMGDALFLSMGLETNVLDSFNEESVQHWIDLNEPHAENQSLEKVQLMFMDDNVLMCKCHKEMWSLNQGIQFYTVPIDIYLPFMLSLTLVGNSLDCIPPELFTSMPNLKDLTLVENKLTSLPDEIGLCHQLLTLSIGSNQLTSLPDSLALCQEMKRLDIDKNRFTEFPRVITKLKNLNRLYAQHLHLKSLPDSIGNLTELTTLSLNGNCFEDLPAGFGKLQKLVSLTLNGVLWLKSKHNVLLSKEHFEDFLRDNNLLHWLDRHNQNKQSIFSLFDEDTNGTLDPKEIGKLNATMFYVFPRFGYRGKTTPDEDTPNGFPKVLLQLKSLEYLSMQYQGLVSLPEEINQLTSLSNLHLGNNPNLLTLPAQLGGLSLKRLELDSCPLLKTPPKEIRARGFVTTYAYLKRLLSGSVSCHRTKLMLVGLGGAGKTSLVKALLNPKKRTELTIGEEITDGIDICPWTVPTPDGGEVTYSVWDFAGQTVYYNTHQFFISDRAVYFLLWNIRLGHEHAGLEFWLNSIRVHAPKAPIFIVGTHLDQVSKVELPMKEMRKQFPQICAFHFVSSHTGQGVQELQEQMVETTLKQRYMGEKIPGVWLTFEENLKRIENRNVIEFRELETRASRSGIFEDSEVIQAVQFLHELGSIQYFTNINLKTHVVINPQWIVDMMACVVSVKDSPIKFGKFRHSDMSKVWKDYEPALHTWMLKLTEEFDLTFQLKDQAINLVPCLLPEKKPEFEWPESDKGNYSRETKMIYKFDYLPAGLFNRSQVRLHQFSDSSLIWKRGSYLKKNKHICLLYQSRDSELTVKAVGPSPENILFLVHEVFESLIMESFKGISYDFSVPCPDCMKLSLKDPHMFPVSIVRRATELKAPFLQCIKYFHTISITDIHATMPPDSNQDFDLHLVQAVRGMKELQHDLAADIFVSYCQLDDKNPAADAVKLGQICADVENLGYRCWIPRESKPQSLDEMAKALLDAKIFLVFMSNNYVKDETCCNLFKYARLTLRKPIVLVVIGEDFSWKQSNMGILMADEVFINMMQLSRYALKFDELKIMLKEKYSPTQVKKKGISHPCFVSYCWQNSAQAVSKGSRTSEGAVGYGDPRDIKDYLDSKGIKCWIDVERVGVHGLFEDIGEGLLKSRVVVVCISDQYAASDNCSIEFRYAANTLKLPIILAVVGTGNKWRASELGIMSLNYPLVSFQEGSESSMGKVLELVKQQLTDKDMVGKEDPVAMAEQDKKDKDALNVTLKEKQQLSLQEISELAQRKFLRQVNQYANLEQNVSYPGVMMVDFLMEEKGESETSSQNDGKEKSPDTTSLASTSLEKQASSAKGETSPPSARQTSATHSKNAHHADFHDQRFGVHLLCEHEEGWHKSGDPILLDQDFGHSLELYLPYVTRVTAIARYSRKLPLNCLAMGVGQKYLHWMEENPIVTLTSDFHESFQALRNIVMNADKDGKMGDLQRCLLPSGKSIWLCPKHRQLMRVTILAKESVADIHHTTQQSLAVDQMLVAMRDISIEFLPAKFRQDGNEDPKEGQNSPGISAVSDKDLSAKLVLPNDDDIDSEMTHNRLIVAKPPHPVKRKSKQDLKQPKTSSEEKSRPLSRSNSKSRACLLM